MSDDQKSVEPVGNETDEIGGQEIREWAEFCAWSALVMTPIIWWLQGPSVSSDQFVVRTGLIVLSATVAFGLRGWALIRRRHDAKMAATGELAAFREEQPK